MPSKKRSRRKPVLRILTTPIEYSTLDDGRVIARKVEERLHAVYDYYGVNRDDPHRLIELMASELFPGGFTKRWEGNPKMKKPTWTPDAKEHLLDFFYYHQEQGLTQEEVARLYMKQSGHERSVKGLIAEFNRAEKWEGAGRPPTNEEMEQAADRDLQLFIDIRRGK